MYYIILYDESNLTVNLNIEFKVKNIYHGIIKKYFINLKFADFSCHYITATPPSVYILLIL